MRFQLCTNPDGGTYLKRKDNEEDNTMTNRILHLDLDALCAIRDALESDMDYSTYGETDYADIDEMYHNYHRCRALLFVRNAIKQEQYQ